MKLAVFHYHLLPGGVTSVITLSAQGTGSFLPDVTEIILVSGLEENLEGVRGRIESGISGNRCTVSAVHLPEIGYTDSVTADQIDPVSLKQILINQFGGCIWWIHNYHIGKNPIFTQALIEIAEERRDQPILFHIHDFPECARYENLRFIKNYYTESLYPKPPNVRYSVINSRDEQLLLNAGIDQEQVVLLQNPVSETMNIPDLSNARKNAVNRFLCDQPNFINGAPTMLYPVRSIRRKNTLEAGLITAIADPTLNLLTTLPGTSDQERGYSDLVAGCFNEGLIHGSFPIGEIADRMDPPIGFRELIAFSDFIVSSSVQEGFGYLFINSLQWKKHLIARNLEIMKDFTHYFHEDFQFLYDHLYIPADCTAREALISAYYEYINSFSIYLDREQIDRLKNETEEMLSRDTIDFSYLPLDVQKDVLKKCRDKEVRKAINSLNPGLAAHTADFSKVSRTAHSVDLEKKFGLQVYADKCGEIFSGLISSSSVKQGNRRTSTVSTDSYIFNYFTELKYFRHLYMPYVP